MRRLVIDSVTSIESAAEREHRAEDYAAALHTYLRQKGVTTLFVKELRSIDSAEIQSADSPLAIVCENLIIMRYVWYSGQFYRVLAVVKMRDSAHERRVCQFVIEQGRGVRLLGDDESQPAAISSITRGLAGSGDLAALEFTRGGQRKRARRGTRDAGDTGDANG